MVYYTEVVQFLWRAFDDVIHARKNIYIASRHVLFLNSLPYMKKKSFNL